MKDAKNWQRGRLLRRYKRFLADVELSDGSELTIHCPNTGSMRECLAPGEYCWFSHSDSKTRKYPNTWEVATTPAGDLAGINTNRANALVAEAIAAGAIVELTGYGACKAEVKYGDENSRIDFLLTGDGPDCYVEVKNVTLKEGAAGQGYFPDAVSSRGSKHLRELALMAESGARAVLLFCVQHTGIERVAAAEHIDPAYSEAFYDAVARGVEVLAYRAEIQPEHSDITLTRRIDVQLKR
ncbi:DNA/RNA nuclease SfsA [uncultured Gilvimarinus sp.]|uniref:DNA/RNA nuclease SfsA n=1 Tax=uncultured Gilvimarinus sp. TaxID=1689143 RepID=UPI0030EE538D|tara:strand:- start:225 stop:944 length:720 start_codon:yes stop_codon:yes gene_type:complete